MNKKIFFIYLIALFIKTESAIFIIHGTSIMPKTYETDKKWFKPKGDFYLALEAEAKKRNLKTITFYWSGSMNNKGRMLAAEDLVRKIAEHIEEKNILMCHSHGGTIGILASKLLNPTPEIPLFTSPEDIHDYMVSYKRLKNERALIESKKNAQKKYPIDCLYLLGTPIHCKKLKPNMNTIEYLFNLYSTGDRVQTILGRYQRMIEPMPRASNLQVIIDNQHPSHRHLHHPVIAKSILSIPFEFKKNKLNGFENFNLNNDGKLIFHLNKLPEYKILNKQTNNSTAKERSLFNLS